MSTRIAVQHARLHRRCHPLDDGAANRRSRLRIGRARVELRERAREHQLRQHRLRSGECAKGAADLHQIRPRITRFPSASRRSCSRRKPVKNSSRTSPALSPKSS